jgi:glycosyltransferase involved in cell wall biosynthesis
MRVLVLDQYGELGGAQHCLIDAVAGFRDRGWEIHAAVPQGALFTRLESLCHSVVPIVCGPFEPARKTARDFLRFVAQLPRQVQLIQSAAFDAIYVNGPRLLPAVALARPSSPVILHAHNAITQRAAARLLTVALRTSKATVIASSNFVARSISSNRLRVIRNGVPPSQLSQSDHRSLRSRLSHRLYGATTKGSGRSEWGRPSACGGLSGRPIVAVLGRIAPEKGQLEFIRAARIARQSCPEAQFVIAGAPMFARADYYDQVRAEAEQAGVTLEGWIEDTDRFLSHTDLLVVPSDAIDATPRVILEAYAARTPVVAFAAGGIPELIEDQHTGILVHDKRHETLAEAIVAALSNPDELNRMATRAYDRWQHEFTIARFQEDVCATIQDTVERRHQRKPLARTGAIAEA